MDIRWAHVIFWSGVKWVKRHTPHYLDTFALLIAMKIWLSMATEVSSWGDFSIDDSHFILHLCIIMRFIHCSYVIHKSITLLLLQAIVISTIGCLWRLFGQHWKWNFDALLLNFLNIFLSYLIIYFCCIEDDCWGERYIGKYRNGQCIRAAYGLLYFEEQSYWFMNIKSQVSTALCCLSVLASTRISGAILDTKLYTASLSILTFPWLLRALFFPMAILHIFFHFCSYMVVWGFGVEVLDLVFGVRVFHWWGSGPVVWGFLGLFGLGIPM